MFKKFFSLAAYVATTAATFFIPVDDGRYAATVVTAFLGGMILMIFVFPKSYLSRLVLGD